MGSIITWFLETFIGTLFSRWFGKHEEQEELADATQPYKNELAIKSKPAGTDSDIVGRL